MGQGLFVKVAQVVADTLQIDLDQIRCTASDTSKVPNASATAASSGSDLNGMAARKAATTIKRRLTEFASQTYGVDEHDIVFHNGNVQVGSKTMSFAELANAAYMARVSLSATGFYKTPKIDYDKATLTGRPFFYFAYGAACTEVVVDTLTGEHRMTRVDILHDCGRSLNPAVDLGQIEGGFIQGAGWLTTEELWWDDRGALRTHAPATYKIPCASDLPPDFRVHLLESADNREDTIYRSKAVGEPPLMLGLSVFHAIRDAVAGCSEAPVLPPLVAPATPENVLRAIEAVCHA
jgi:xanthine dehydrogenase large subunit